MKDKKSFNELKNSVLFLGLFFFFAFHLKGQNTYDFDGQILVQSNLGLKKGSVAGNSYGIIIMVAFIAVCIILILKSNNF